MAVRTKPKAQKMHRLWGDKGRGVSLYKLNYKTPRWRVAFWKNGRLITERKRWQPKSG
jgi:hypothetical protein